MKALLFFTFLFLLANGYAQKQNVKTTDVDMAKKLTAKYDFIASANEQYSANSQAPLVVKNNSNSLKKTTSQRASQGTITWQKISGSMNIYGVTEISSKPLQYDDELDAVSFVHRKSQTYLPQPIFTASTAASGAIITMVSKDCGTTWDSTCVWNNANEWARYPQGGLYNPPGNTDLSKAYAVVTGPLTSAASLWVGSYLASKKLDVVGGSGYNNVASTVPNAQQFAPNSGTLNPTLGKFDYPSVGFSSTDDGLVRSLGIIVNDFNGTGSARKYSGAKVLKGAFSAGVFNWTSNDILVAQLTVSNTAGDALLFGSPNMAWNEDGSVGYVVQFGCRSGAPGSQSGFQPIIYKTSDGGNNWNLMPAISFSSPQFQSKVMKRLEPVSNSTLVIPMFNPNEGIDCVVDKDNRLHIVSTLLSSKSADTESISIINTFQNWDDDEYSFKHSPGRHAYIYDFIETSGGWNVEIVDSMSSESPGESSSQAGFDDNPWDASGGTGNNAKVSSSARIQASRTPDGKFIIYTWAESDTNDTNKGKKWNSKPNLKARAYDATNKLMSMNEINLTTSANPELYGRAQMHHTSPKSKYISGVSSAGGAYIVDVKTPMTITTNGNSPLLQQTANDHYYTCSTLSFIFNNDLVGINEIKSEQQLFLQVFPNPANNNIDVKYQLTNASSTRITILNLTGQVVKEMEVSGTIGTNQISVDIEGLPQGIYFVSVNTENGVATQKLIKQ